MQKPISFEHQIYQPRDFTFLTDSIEKTVDQNLALFTNSSPGIASGLNLTFTNVGDGYFFVSKGFGYDGNGVRIELFDKEQVQITFTGTKAIFARNTTSNYNPDPAENPAGPSNVVKAINPDDNSLVPVQQYDLTFIDTTGVSSDIRLGSVTADSDRKILSLETDSADHLKIANFIDIVTQTIDGGIIQSGTMDSNAFTTPLTYDITLGTGTDIFNQSGGINNLGSSSAPFSNIYANTGTFHQINGQSPILIDNMTQLTGTSLESNSTYVEIDKNSKGTRFGGNVITKQVNPGLASDLTIYAQDDDISITTPGGDVRITPSSTTHVGTDATNGNLKVSGNLTLAGDFYPRGNVDLNNANLTISQNNFSTKNIVINSDFAVGYPLYYTGTQIYTGSKKYKDIALLDAWDPNNAGLLAPYGWSITESGSLNYARSIVGTSETTEESVARNEIQKVFFTLPITFTGTNGFKLSFTSGVTTDTTDYMPYNIEPTGMQAQLTGLSNIGAGNVSVTGTASGNYYVEFIGALQSQPFDNMTIAANDITPPPQIEKVQAGNYPVPIEELYKDPNLFFGNPVGDVSPGLNHFVRLISSGVTAGSPFRFATQLSNLKPNKDYNVSTYFKSLSQTLDYNIKFGIFDSEDATGSGTGFVSFDQSIGDAGWQRLSKAINVSVPSRDFYLILEVTPTNASVDPILNLAGVQVTEGPNLFGYNKGSNTETNYNIIHPQGIANTSGWNLNYVSAALNFYAYLRTATGGFNIVSGNFYSPGALCEICYEGSGLWNHCWHYITIDGETVFSAFTNAGDWDLTTGKVIKYISKGRHEIKLIDHANHSAYRYWNIKSYYTTPTAYDHSQPPSIKIRFL